MADFLTRIIERTTGSTPVVHPVITPIFAPGPPIAGESGEDTSLDDQDSAEVSLESFQDQAQLGAQALSLPSAPRFSSGSPAKSPDDQPVTRKPDDLPQTRALLSELPESQPERNADGHTPIQPDEEAPVQVSIPLNVRARSEQRQADNRKPIDSPGLERPYASIRPLAVPPEAPGERDISTAPSIEPAFRRTPERIQVISPMVRAPQQQGNIGLLGTQTLTRRQEDSENVFRGAGILPAYQGEQTKPEATELTASTTIIQVTIGRVEVRAIIPPAKPEKKPGQPVPSGPKLTLENYLKQRNEGKL